MKIVPRSLALPWFERLMEQEGLSASAIAKQVGLGESNLYKFLNDPAGKRGLSRDTMGILARHFRFPVPNETSGFAEDEAAPYTPEPNAHFAPKLSPSQCYYEVKAGDLGGAQLKRGDILVVDLKTPPCPGDLVIVQKYDEGSATAETLIRWLEPPYLMPVSLERGERRPLILDNDETMVKGVVVEAITHRVFDNPFRKTG